jgi:hypothetical protein
LAAAHQPEHPFARGQEIGVSRRPADFVQQAMQPAGKLGHLWPS